MLIYGVGIVCILSQTEVSYMLIQDGEYYRLGQLLAMAVIHGGAAVHILCPSVFTFLSGMKPCDIVVTIDEVPDASVRDILWKVS